MKAKILVLDDDLTYLEGAKTVLRYTGREVDYFSDPAEAIVAVEQNPYLYALAFVDHQYKDKDSGNVERLGVQIAGELKELNPMMTVCIVSGDSSEEALRGWLSPAIDHYRYKNMRRQETLIFAEHHVREYEKNFIPVSEHQVSLRPNAIKRLNPDILGHSPLLVECCEKSIKFAESDLNVLIMGDTGVGKELFAKGIHKKSKRHKHPLYSINCAGNKSEPEVLEVDLFGRKNKAGIFEKADKATLFLDNVQDLTPACQAKLLKILERKKVQRLGSDEKIPVNVRLIAASKNNLAELCQNGLFSVDLYYKLKGLDLEIPPLRERKEDIVPLVFHFLRKSNKNPNLVKRISKKALYYLERYHWPHNAHEIEQVMKQLNVVTDDLIIAPRHLPPKVKSKRELNESSLNILELEREFKEKQKAFILRALEESNHNISNACRRLGFGEKRSTLRSRMKQLKMDTLTACQKKGLLYKFQQMFMEI